MSARLWAIRETHEGDGCSRGKSHVTNPYLSDEEVEETVWFFNANSHGKTYTAELADGTPWPGE